MVIPPSRNESCLITVGSGQLKSQQAAIKIEGSLQIRDFKMYVANARGGRYFVIHLRKVMKPGSGRNVIFIYSLRKLCEGFVAAALSACMLTMVSANTKAAKPDTASAHQGKSIR